MLTVGQKVTIASGHYDKQNHNLIGTIKQLSAFPEVLVTTENNPQGTWVQTAHLEGI